MRVLSSAVERRLYTALVGSSILSAPTTLRYKAVLRRPETPINKGFRPFYVLDSMVCPSILKTIRVQPYKIGV